MEDVLLFVKSNNITKFQQHLVLSVHLIVFNAQVVANFSVLNVLIQKS